MPCENAKTSSDIEHVDWSTGTGSGHHYANVRFGSGSSQASQSSGDICRICHCESDPQNPLLTPCYCSGSLKYVHQSCLQQWLTASETNSCELCKFPFIMHTKIKPFNEWRSLDISGIERRRLCCSVLFHCAAALCVIWSLCVLIERAADDVQRGLIDWPFWTKLAVVTVGLTGGIVFMYIQCKAYLHLCHRWKARNRILLIQNAPEKVHPLAPPSPLSTHHTRNSCGIDAHVIASHHAAVGAERINAGNASHAYNYAIGGGGGVGVIGSANAGSGASHAVANAGNESACIAAAAAAMQPSERLLKTSVTSPHHMLPHADLDAQSAQDTSSLTPSSHHHHHHHHHHHMHAHAQQQQQQQLPQQLGQVAVAANIESQSQHNYERDWALDDVVSQISSFRPCPQGSGSMTPFHDSIHNVLEHSESSSRISANDLCLGSRQDLSTGGISSDTGREHALQLSSFSGSGEHKAPSISSGVSNAVANGLGGFVYRPHTKRYSNSSIFLENRDILNDSVALGLESPTHNVYDYSTPPKIDYRHSSILTASGQQLPDAYMDNELRRFSDTKLQASCSAEIVCDGAGTTGGDVTHTEYDPMLLHGTPAADNKRVRQLLLQKQAIVDTVLDMELPTSPLSPPAAYASHTNSRQNATAAHTLRRSYDTVELFGGGVEHVALTAPNTSSGTASNDAAQIDRSRLFFKSLPNLSSSCENLIKK